MNKFFEQLTEQLSNSYVIFFLIAYGLSLFMYHMKNRRRLLGTKFVSDSNFAIYYYLLGGLSGALGAIIAGLGGLIQALTPDRYMAKTKYFRLCLAIVLSSISIHFAAAKSSDMLPLLAIIFGRLAEMSSTPQRVRIGMAITFPPWIIYNFTHEFYLLLFANLTALCSLFWAIWKHRRIRYIAEPV